MIVELFVSLSLITNCLSQTFQHFGAYEYYWSDESSNYARNYAEAQQQCSRRNATLAVVNTKEVGEFLKSRIRRTSYSKFG